jgi:hypothetical protein
MQLIQHLTNYAIMGQLQWIPHCTSVAAVALTALRVHHVASAAETWRIQCYVFIRLHLMLKRGNYSAACSEAWRIQCYVFFGLHLMLKRVVCF